MRARGSTPEAPGDFRPASLLGGPHAQTIFPAIFRRGGPSTTATVSWPSDDGETLDLELLPDRPGRAGVLVLHGLEGSSRARYVRGLLKALDQRGWNAAALNFRSCGPSPVRGPRLYHSGDTRDLPLVVTRLRARWGGPLAVWGFSMGGNVVLKWLGEEGDRAPVDAAVAMSVPFDLGACAAALDRPGLMPALYRHRFLRSLRRKAFALTGAPLDVRTIRSARTFSAYDECVTAPIFGFTSAADYWARSSSAGFLPAVRRPTLLVHALDDPMVPAWSVPHQAIAANPVFTTWFTARGGHVGFVAGTPWRPRWAGEERALAFLNEHLR